MNWLARLKKSAVAPETDATEPTKPGFVGFVAPIPAHIQKTGGDSEAANDAPAGTPSAAPDRLRAASLALDAVILESGMAADPDRWCWPQSTALNTEEIDTCAAQPCPMRYAPDGATYFQPEMRLSQRIRRCSLLRTFNSRKA